MGSYLDQLFVDTINKENVKVVFELGSRDLKDAVKLINHYNCPVYAFECNPDCLQECEKTLSKIDQTTKDKLCFERTAVSLVDGPVTFYPFDLTKYNNMGSSSMLKIDFSKRNLSDPDYNRPNPQKEITVPGTRLDTYLKGKNINIDLLCMDLQGYELNALKSLGSRLHDVKYIITECSIENTYVGGPSFKELEVYLAQFNFEYKCSNAFNYSYPDLSLTGSSEFDALFINKSFINKMDAITTFLTTYYDQTLVNSPKPHPMAVTPVCIYLKEIDLSPEFSVVMPIHNQETIITDNLNSVLKHMDGTFEMILVVDACSDQTLERILDWVEQPKPQSLTRLVVILSVTPLFETAADNIGFRLAKSPYILEIQADMLMTEKGFNRILERPFKRNENVIGVSGRCAHDFLQTTCIGKLGQLVEQPYDPALSQTNFYVFGTCNRGPLLLHKEKVQALGYLDEANYFLDNSDHDLFARAFKKKSWICGYVPIEFLSPLVDGSTRKPRDSLNQLFYNDYKLTKKGGFYEEYVTRKETIQPKVLPC